MADGIGLSIGATALRAVAVDRSAVRRSPVVTRYPNRPAEVGVPSENPNLTQRGLIITDFVDRVGDPVAIVASDGSSHRAEVLLADALRALVYALTGGRRPAEPVGVTHPAHWRPPAVDALRRALGALPDFGAGAPVVSESVASLTALHRDPGVPTRGIVALCDFGGTGTSVTLADAANGFQPVGPTVRHAELSGDLIDQALLARVVGDLAAARSVDLVSTSAIGSLSRLRSQCRAAKERLSTTPVTSLAVDLPGHRTEVRVTRTELDDAIRTPLGGFLDVVQDTLQRNGIRPGDLVAIASVGGGARMPIVTTTLSDTLRAPVITSGVPELAAAIGAGLAAARSLVPDGATSMAPAAPAPVAAPIDTGAPASSTFRALAWSDAEDLAEPTPQADPSPDDATGLAPYGQPFDPRPQLEFSEPEADDAVAAPVPWFRRPLALAAIAVVVAVAAIGGASLYVLRNGESTAPSSTTGPVTTTMPPETAAPSSPAAPPETEAPAPQAPGTRTVIEQAPPVTETPPPVTETAAPSPTPTTEAPTTTTTEAPPVTVTQTETPSPTPTTQPRLIPTLPYQTIPGLPFVPAPVQPAQP